MFEGKKAVIFDLDGTLLDSIGVYNEVDRDIINENGGNPPEDTKTLGIDRTEFASNNPSGNLYLNYCNYLINKYNLNRIPEELYRERESKIIDYHKSRVNLKPFAERFLKELNTRKIKVFLATVTSGIVVDMYFNNNALISSRCNLSDIFGDNVLTKEDVSESKPNPEIYLKALELLNLRSEECIVIEDSLIGVKAAKGAGLEVISIYDKYSDKHIPQIVELSDYHVSDYTELINSLINGYRRKL